MRKIREVLRYHFESKLSNEEIGGALNVSKGFVFNTLSRFKQSGLFYPMPETLSDSTLDNLLYPPTESISKIPLPDINYIEQELRKKHVTLQRLWEEYHDSYPTGMGRSKFYTYVKEQQPTEVDMKKIEKGGDKLYVDYSGDSLSYIDKESGEIRKTELFVCSWGASSYSFVEATSSQNQENFVSSHVHALNYFGVSPKAFVPDNLKSAVLKANRFDPELNPLYAKCAVHYQVAILPARVRKPKDKAMVESNVLHVQRFILARLRNHTFYSLNELNEAIYQELELFNNRPMKDYGNSSRKERFEKHDKLFANKLPQERFIITKVKIEQTVKKNYTICFDDHHYSVPHILAHQKVDVFQSGKCIEIYHDGCHVASHKKGVEDFSYTMNSEHMPKNHRFMHQLSKQWYLDKASKIGTNCEKIVGLIIEKKQHIEQGFRAAQYVLNLAKAYGSDRLEIACVRAFHYNSISKGTLKSILEHGYDKQPLTSQKTQSDSTETGHENIRGANYYQQKNREEN